MNEKQLQDLCNAFQNSLAFVFESPNETDRNFENANVVDALFEIARSIRQLADAVASLRERE